MGSTVNGVQRVLGFWLASEFVRVRDMVGKRGLLCGGPCSAKHAEHA